MHHHRHGPDWPHADAAQSDRPQPSGPSSGRDGAGRRVPTGPRGSTVTVMTESIRQPIRVFLVDDHEIVRQGVAALLDVQDDLEVVGEAGTAAEALARIPAARPDVAVLDVRLPDDDGVHVCRTLTQEHPDVACLMLTSYADDEALFDAVMAGARGFVLKEVRGGDLVQAIRTVAAGGSLLDPVATTRLLDHLRAKETAPADPLRDLTDQERRVLDLIAQGLTNREIGAQLFVAEKTVKNYVSSLLAKLGMQRRAQAAALAAQVHAQAQHPRR